MLSRLELNLTNSIFVCSLGFIFRTVRRQHYGTSTIFVHFCHVACSVDGFRVRLELGRESGSGAFKCIMLCGYFEEKYLCWHNLLIQNVRRNDRLVKRNNEISRSYEHPVGGDCPGGSCPGVIVMGGNYPKGVISWGFIVWGTIIRG